MARFVPDPKWNPTKDLHKTEGGQGIIDKFGNIWRKGSSRTPGQPFEWDVQFSQKGLAQYKNVRKGRTHLNVSLDGKITH